VPFVTFRGQNQGTALNRSPINIRQSFIKQVDLAHNFVIKAPTMVVIISGQFVTKRLPSIESTEVKSWRPQN
jgi:hypothetical protein